MSFNVGSGMGVYPESGGEIVLGSGPFQAIITAN